jgi:hypothetical protein
MCGYALAGFIGSPYEVSTTVDFAGGVGTGTADCGLTAAAYPCNDRTVDDATNPKSDPQNAAFTKTNKGKCRGFAVGSLASACSDKYTVATARISEITTRLNGSRIWTGIPSQN